MVLLRSDCIPIGPKTFRKKVKTKQIDVIDNLIKGTGKHHSEILKERMKLAQRLGYEKEMSELALVARKKIQNYQNENGQIKSLFSLFDTHRRGNITYDDFTDTFLSAGISQRDGYRLASAIDKNKCGIIEYNNILDALKDVESFFSKSNSINPNNDINDTNKNNDGVDNKERNRAKDMIHINTDLSPQYLSQKYKPISLSSYLNYNQDSNTIPLSPILKQSQQNWMVYNDMENFQKQQKYKIGERRHVIPMSKNVFALDLGESKEYRSSKKYLKSSSNNLDNLYRLNLDHTGRKTQFRSQSAPPMSRKNSEIDINNIRSCDLYESISTNNNANSNKIKHENNLLSSPIKKERSIKSTNMIENTLISQLSGRISTLRHILNKEDMSKSGGINFKEFNNAIKRVGIIVKKENLFQLFTECCDNNNYNKSLGISGHGLGLDIDSNGSLVNTISGSGHEKILNINSFIERVQQTTNSPINSHKLSDNDRTNSYNHEVLRSLKKINYIMDNNNNIKDILHKYIGKSKNWVSPGVLRNFYNNLGANLSETEFSSLLEKININHKDESININDFIDKTHNDVIKLEMVDNNKRIQVLQSNPNYNNTYKSNNIINYFNENEHNNNKLEVGKYKSSEHNWKYLKSKLQLQSKNILRVFGVDKKESNKRYKSNITKLSQLSPFSTPQNISFEKLANGLLLGNEDKTILLNELNKNNKSIESIDKNEMISLNKFCDICDIPFEQVGKYNETVLRESIDNCLDGGVFASSLKSQIANDTYSTSMYISGEEKSIFYKNNCKKKSPKSHFTSDKSNFWDLNYDTHTSYSTMSQQPNSPSYNKTNLFDYHYKNKLCTRKHFHDQMSKKN